MANFNELRAFTRPIARFFDAFPSEDIHLDPTSLDAYLHAGDLRLFTTERNGQFVMATFVDTTMTHSAGILLLSNAIADQFLTSFSGQEEHMKAMLALLKHSYPGMRLIFETNGCGEGQVMAKHLNARCIVPLYEAHNPFTGEPRSSELWAFPTSADDTLDISREQLAEWVYTIQRMGYVADAREAEAVLVTCNLPVDAVARYEAAICKIAQLDLEPVTPNWTS
jgi:hypothetical protein